MLVRPRGRDRAVLAHANGLFQGYHVRATLPDTTAELVRDSGKPYLVDPDTYIFAFPSDRLLDPRKKPPDLRRSASTLATAYGAPFRDIAGKRRLDPTDFCNPVGARNCVERVLNYQRSKLTMQAHLPFDPYYEKYQLWDDREPTAEHDAHPMPQVLVPPYFYFRSPDDEWLKLNVELGRHALAARREGDLVYPILLFRSGLLADTRAVDLVARRYLAESFDGFLLWPNNFVEEREREESLRGLARLVETLAASGRRVSKLYGGYLSALLSRRGLRGFSCGLGYGSHKNAFAYGGGGRKVAERFYVPRLHQALEIDEAARILQTCPDLRCSCATCQEVYGTRMDRFAKMCTGGPCEMHFLHARRDELQVVAQAGGQELAADLVRVAARIERAGLQQVPYLRSWAGVIAA